MRFVVRQHLPAWSLGLGLLLTAQAGHADKVHLASGTVIEGKAQRVGDKVVVEVEGGKLTLSAESVTRIEESETELERVDARLSALAEDDVAGLMQLANHCRNRELRAREREILRRVLSVDSDHAEARARLGYVRSEAGWVTEAEKRKAEGYVLVQGRWLSEEQLLATRKLEAETRISELERERAELALREKQQTLAAQKEEARQRAAERERAQANAQDGSTTGFGSGFGYLGPVIYGGYPIARPGVRHAPGRFSPVLTPPSVPPGPPSPTPGFRDPANQSFQVPGYQDPRNYFRP